MNISQLLKSPVPMKVVSNIYTKGPLLNELSQVNYHSGEIISFVFGSLGMIMDSTNKSLKKLKLTKQKELLQMTVIKGSYKIMCKHF